MAIGDDALQRRTATGEVIPAAILPGDQPAFVPFSVDQSQEFVLDIPADATARPPDPSGPPNTGLMLGAAALAIIVFWVAIAAR